MKKKIAAIVLAIVTVFAMTACGSEPQAPVNGTDKESKTESSSIQETGTSEEIFSNVDSEVDDEYYYDGYEDYYEWDAEGFLIGDYYLILKDLYNTVFLGATPIHPELEDMSAEVYYWDDEDKANVGYCFVDLNGDDYMELLIGYGDTVYALGCYACDGTDLIAGAGYRSYLTIYENSVFTIEGSSGADAFSSGVYEFHGDWAELVDFFYTDWSDEKGDIAYYSNPDGEWIADPMYEITEEEFGMSSEIGLEALDFSGVWKPIGDLEYFSIGQVGVSMADLCPEGVTWSLESYETAYGSHWAEFENNIQTLNYTTDGYASYYQNACEERLEEDEFWVEDCELYDYSDEGKYSFYFQTLNGNSMMITALGFTEDGLLIVQKEWSDPETYYWYTITEYYAQSMG